MKTIDRSTTYVKYNQFCKVVEKIQQIFGEWYNFHTGHTKWPPWATLKLTCLDHLTSKQMLTTLYTTDFYHISYV